MYGDDQEEDVEEEEEFHEVQEERNKTPPNAVNDSSGKPADSPEKTTTPDPKPSNDKDWANIMLRSQSRNSDLSDPDEPSSSHAPRTETTLNSQDAVKPNDESIIDTIIKDTQDKLKIVDESCDSIGHDPIVVETTCAESTELTGTSTEVSPVENEVACANHIDQVELVSQQRDGENLEVPFDTQSHHDTNTQAEHDQHHQEDATTLSSASTSQDAVSAECELESRHDSRGPDVEQEQTSSDYQELITEPSTEEAAVADLEAGAEAGPGVEPEAETAPEEKKQDEVEKKELDLDEDVKNPQYIPKKGVFYEHDDRSHDVEEKKPSTTNKKEEDSVENKDAGTSKRTPSQDKQAENRRSNRRQRTDADRWNHDLFRGEKQKPKSKSELINAYGYDIRQERGGRNQLSDNRQSRSSNNSNAERTPVNSDGQRSRQPKEGRSQRQNQPSNRSRERRSRRQNTSKTTQQQRNDGSHVSENKRDMTNNRTPKNDVKDTKNIGDEKVPTPTAAVTQSVSIRREHEVQHIGRNPRNDSRGRRKTSRDRPNNNDERLPLTNTVMPPITTWSNEDMMKAEAFVKKSPPRIQNASAGVATSSNNNAQRDRSNDLWQQGPQNKTIYHDRPLRNQDESRQQGYNNRGRYQERGDENHRSGQNLSRNHYHDRSSQSQDWNRANNYNQYGKPNDYIVKTQTFENSRLAQANMNRSSNSRDLREVINERRMQGQHNYQNKMHHGGEHHANPRVQNQGQLYHNQYAQSHLTMHQHQMSHHQSAQSHMMQAQQAPAPQHIQQSQQQAPRHMQIPTSSQQLQATNQTQPQPNPPASAAQIQNHRQQPTTTQAQTHQGPSRSATIANSATPDGGSNNQDIGRAPSGSGAIDLTSSRPIVKTDAYTGNLHSHQQTISQHSQNHRAMGGSMTQHGPAPAASHMVPTHMNAGAQPQYYTPSPGSRDPTGNAAGVGPAYHGYMPGGHTVMDATRYHMASQQIPDHGYMTTTNQANDVSGGPVLHQQGMYTDTSTGGAVANSAFMTQHPGSTISPNTNIPITGTGSQLPPVSYIQHSQYPPPPYGYTQPQHNQGPHQSGHAYHPYWTYI